MGLSLHVKGELSEYIETSLHKTSLEPLIHSQTGYDMQLYIEIDENKDLIKTRMHCEPLIKEEYCAFKGDVIHFRERD